MSDERGKRSGKGHQSDQRACSSAGERWPDVDVSKARFNHMAYTSMSWCQRSKTND